MIVENLRQFGLNEKEISVYLSLIFLGSSPVRTVAKQAGVNRGTTYDILKNLIELGLASYYKRHQQEDKRQYFVAEPPQKLLLAIENKKKNLETLKTRVEKMLPELESLYEKSGTKPVVRYYEGNSGIRIILQDVIERMKQQDMDKKLYYVYSSADIRDYLYKAYPHYTEDRVVNKIAVQAIAIGKGGRIVGLDERKWLSEEESSPTYVLIYSGKVAMITIDAAKHPVGVIIEDQGLYQTQEMIFKKLWEKL